MTLATLTLRARSSCHCRSSLPAHPRHDKDSDMLGWSTSSVGWTSCDNHGVRNSDREPPIYQLDGFSAIGSSEQASRAHSF